MSRNTKIINIGLFCIGIGILLMYLMGVFNTAPIEYNGNRILGETEFILDFTEINAAQSHTMELKKDDELDCSFRISKGTVDVLILSAGGDKLYQGDRVDHAEFKLVVPSDSEYTFTVTGKQAAGVISIRKDEK